VLFNEKAIYIDHMQKRERSQVWGFGSMVRSFGADNFLVKLSITVEHNLAKEKKTKKTKTKQTMR
jgi:hypothetical protein